MNEKLSSETDFSIPAEWFSSWWKPDELLAAVKVHKRGFQLFEEMYRPELKPLREAWVASRFAEIWSQGRPVAIKLEADRFPDFIVRIHEETFPFELIEAYEEGRRRDDEYRRAAARKLKGLPQQVGLCDHGREEEAALAAITRAIEKKAKKKYSSAPHLLVYVNFFCTTDNPPITSLFAFQLGDRWSDDFKNCWLLWKNCTSVCGHAPP